MIRFYLDGTLYENPDGWDELRSKIKRDDNLNAVLIFQEASVEFTGDAYTYLYDKLITDGFCSVVEIEVQQSCSDGNTYQTLFKGRIFLADCEFNERTGKAQAKLEDNSYYSLIKNNAKIKTALDTDLTKNGQPLTQAPVYEVDFYSVSANTLTKSDVPCMRVYDAFKYLISFMTDNKVGFASSLFDIGGRWEGLCITTGERIRTNTDLPWQQINFTTLINEVYYATEPLIMIIEDPYGSPVIRIEDRNYSYANTTNFLLENVYEVVTGVEQAKLYSSVTVGSSNVDDTFSTTNFPENIDFLGFKSEQLFITGECNIDNDLQLTGDFIRSSNIIDKQLLNQDYDKEFFLIHTELASNVSGRTTNTNIFNESPPRYYYNDALRNSEIMNRWSGGLPSSLIKYVGVIGDGLFEATSAALQTFSVFTGLTAPVQFTNIINNSGGFWDGTDTYTAATTGIYYFTYRATITNVAPNVGGIGRAMMRVFDSGNNFKYEESYTFSLPSTGGGFVNIVENYRLTLNTGDYAQLFTVYESPGIQAINVITGASLECTSNTIGGAAINTYDPTEYPVLTYTFDYPLTDNQFNSLVLNPIGKIGFAMASQPFRYGWVKDISYNHINKSATIKLITSQSNAT